MHLPIGTQDFPTIIENGGVYVDKTELIKRLLNTGQYIFLARPRRFGKSLLLSTIASIFRGRQELFKGLWLEGKHDFVIHPVIHLDFSLLDYHAQSLEVALVNDFRRIAREFGVELQASTPKSAFEELIRALSKDSQVVILVDEYDQAITDFLLEPQKRLEHQRILKSLYGVFKPLNANIKFLMLTGVSKIGKVSLFSDLNNIFDISLDESFGTLCGYTKAEIERFLLPDLEQVAKRFQKPLLEFWSDVQHWYNGYSWDGISTVYCPFSFLVFLAQKRFKSYWYETGTPTFLMQLIRSAQLNPLEFENVELGEKVIVSTDIENVDAISLMFQTGYLTIKKIEANPRGTQYQLGYPNEEVRQAFSVGLLEEYASLRPFQADSLGLELQRALIHLDWDVFFAAVNRTLAGIPYEIFPRQEIFVHSLVHIMLISTGFRTQSQTQTSLGRMDTLVETPDHSIIFEYKLNGTPEAALAQITEKGYANSLRKPVIKVGVVFDLENKKILSWAVQS
jgi:hypothetical protein